MTEATQGTVTIVLGIINIVAILIGWIVVYLGSKRLQKLKAIEGLCFNLIEQLNDLKLIEHKRPILGNREFLADVNRVARCISQTNDCLTSISAHKTEENTIRKIKKSVVELRQIYSLDNINSDKTRIERANIQISRIQSLIYGSLTTIH